MRSVHSHIHTKEAFASPLKSGHSLADVAATFHMGLSKCRLLRPRVCAAAGCQGLMVSLGVGAQSWRLLMNTTEFTIARELFAVGLRDGPCELAFLLVLVRLHPGWADIRPCGGR